jgi:ribosomal protein S18 acetylase RimI-like enzyme
MIIKKPVQNNLYSILAMIKTYFSYTQTTLEKIKKEFFDNKNIFFIAEEKKHVIAFIHAKEHKNKIFILGLATLPEYRNRGVARKLIKRMMSKCKKPLMLIVEENNENAIKLYEKLGFDKKGYSRKTLYGRKIIKMRFDKNIKKTLKLPHRKIYKTSIRNKYTWKAVW